MSPRSPRLRLLNMIAHVRYIVRMELLYFCDGILGPHWWLLYVIDLRVALVEWLLYLRKGSIR
jgi:hypothetical protein